MIEKYLINRKDATVALIDGFCVLFGEKHRKFLTNIGEEIIELGMKNGVEWAKNLVLKDTSFYIFLESSDTEAKIISDLSKYFTDVEVKEFLDYRTDIKEYAGHYMSGLKPFEQKIVKVIKERDLILKEATSFSYFKSFGLSDKKQFESCTLFGEGGLCLDQYEVLSTTYYQAENEVCYLIEAICRKFHHLGQLLARNEALKDMVIKARKLTPDVDHRVGKFFANSIRSLSLESITNIIIHDIQNEIGKIDGFMTNDQITEKLKNTTIDLPDTLFN